MLDWRMRPSPREFSAGFIIVLALLAQTLSAASEKSSNAIESHTFETPIRPPALQVPKIYQRYESILQNLLQTQSEGDLVVHALNLGWKTAGLNQVQADSLWTATTNAYRSIRSHEAYADLPSALSRSWSTLRPVAGHYFLHRPAKVHAGTQVIVFLHGFGGNFQFYIWALAQEFPDSVILTPTWGISWANGRARYLKDMLADAETRLDAKIDRPWLMAVSAGGRAGFRIYNQMHDRFLGYIALASAPESTAARSLRKDLRILMLNGRNDRMVPLATARNQAALARRRARGLQFKEIDGDHFFMLNRRREAFAMVKSFMARNAEVSP